MRNLTPSELLALNTLMQMEVNGLAVSKAALHAVNDAELKKMTEAGIMSTEARIKGFQQFVSENGILSGGM